MDTGQLNVETLTQLLTQQTQDTSVDATLLTIREFYTLPRKDLTMLVNRFIFCHTQTSQQIWIKTLNNIQELHALDKIRQCLENQTDFKMSTHMFHVLFVEILTDAEHPWFTLYYNLFLKFLSLVLSFDSERTLNIIAQWFLTIQTNLLRKFIEYIIFEHLALIQRKSLQKFCFISPLFSLIFLTQTCILLNEDHHSFDKQIFQTLIEFLTYGLTNSTNVLLLNLEKEIQTDHANHCNFLPAVIQLDLFSRFQSELNLIHDYFHTSILSFLFSIMMNNNQLKEHFLVKDFFHQLALKLVDHQSNESIQHYLQIFSICQIRLRHLSITQLGKEFSFFKTHHLYEILLEKEQQQS